MPGVYIGLYLNLNCDLFQNMVKWDYLLCQKDVP